MLGEVRSDRLESSRCVLVIGASRQSLADGIGNDIDLRVAPSVYGGPFGEGDNPVAEQFDAISAIDLAWCEAPLLLGKSNGDADDPVNDRKNGAQ